MSNLLENTSSEIDSNKPKNESKSINKLYKISREILAIFFWGYLFTKVFVFDIDNYFINKYFPSLSYLLYYKFFILIGIIAIIIFFTKNKYIIIWSLYIFTYPLLVVFWKIPKYIFKQRSWILALALINSVISFLISIKYSFITMALYLLSTIVILRVSNKILLVLSITLIICILILTYYNRVVVIFKRSNIHKFYMTVISALKEKNFQSVRLEEDIKNLPLDELTEQQMQKRTTNLELTVLSNRLLMVFAVKLKTFQDSKLNFLTYIFTTFLLIAITIFSLCLINYGVFKIDSNQFSFEKQPTFFTFFYYSFSSMFPVPAPKLTPVSPFPQIIAMMGTSIAYFIAAIFIALLFSVKSKRHAEELNEIISGFHEQGSAVEKFIKEEYKINNIEEALMELEKVKGIFVKFLYKISESIK